MFRTLLGNSTSLCVRKKIKVHCGILSCRKHWNSGSPEVKLSYNLYEPQQSASSPKTSVIILHGLLGSKQNWRSLGKVMSNRSGRKVYALDTRNHGDSPHTDEFNYPLMAYDVEHFMKSSNISQAVVMGHSMGGRTAMYLALCKPELVERLIIVDVSPCDMPEDTSSVIPGYFKAMKEAMRGIPLGTSITQARKLAERHMSQTIPEKGICQFLLTNLTEGTNNNFEWKANLDVLEKTFESGVRSFSIPNGYYNKETLFICGGNSPYVRESDHASIKEVFPKAEFIYIPGAGHWVHSEKPSEFLVVINSVI